MDTTMPARENDIKVGESKMKKLLCSPSATNFQYPGRNILLFVFAFSLFFCTKAFGAGGDILWQYDDARAAKQEALSSVVDSEGNTIPDPMLGPFCLTLYPNLIHR